MNCNDLMIDVRTVNSFSAVDTSMPTLTYDSDGNVTNSWKYELGGADKVVVMRLMYMLPVISGPLGFDLSNMRRSEEHTSELQSLMRISYAVFCLKKKKKYYK